MQKIIFVSDPHICAAGERIIGLDPLARLATVLDAALGDHPDAAAVVFLGDLTHHGAEAEYTALRDLLADYARPITLMLGNHDRREAFTAAFPDAPVDSHGFAQSIQNLGDTCLITLDSLDGPPYPPHHHAGRLCEKRLSFLRDALEQARDQRAIVCIHHPDRNTGIIGMDRIRLTDAPAFLSVLATHPDVYLVCGHVHRNISGKTAGIPWTMFKSPCHQGVLDLSSRNSHLSGNDPSGYGLMLVSSEGIVVHSVDVNLPDYQVFGGYDEAKNTNPAR